MPTYDYVCRECDHRWEVFQSIKAKPLRKCPECGKLKAKRVIGPGAGIIFKGSGFYQTDYRSKAYKDAAKADREKASSASKESSADSGSQKSGTSEAKPSTSTE